MFINQFLLLDHCQERERTSCEGKTCRSVGKRERCRRGKLESKEKVVLDATKLREKHSELVKAFKKL